MIKAFLSHSSVNKEFVLAVAEMLGRQFCLVDAQAFDSGISFKQSIEKHLDESSVFVLFGSRSALDSLWVDFEISEASQRVIEKTISRALVILIESGIDHSELPPWLRRARVVRHNGVKAAAREIRQHVDDLLREAQHQIFEGRTVDISAFQKLLTPIDKPAPRVFVVHGLPSIGRRTFLRKAVPIALNFSRLVEIEVADGDFLADIAIKVANELEPYSTRVGFDQIVESIRASSEKELLARILRDLRGAVFNRELPILFDKGGAITIEGHLTDPVQKIVSEARHDLALYLCIVSTRRPAIEIDSQRLDPLSREDVSRLVSRISAARVPAVVLSASQILELADYINGYPPSAYYAVSLAADYGASAVIADKHRLVEFRTGALLRYLRQKPLTGEDKVILALLARYSPLPIEALSSASHLESGVIAARLMNLMDSSLIVLGESGLYALAEPMVDAVLREIDVSLDHRAVYEAVRKLVNEDEVRLPRLELYRALFRAVAMGNIQQEQEVFHLASDVIRAAEQFYRQRDYQRAMQFSTLAVRERPQSIVARDYLIRALIQEEEWDEAEAQLKEFQKIGPARDAAYLKGFLERKRGNHLTAVDHFLEALRLGRTGFAVQREIAYCYYLENKLDEAKRYLAGAIAKSDNHIALDLWIQIAVREGDEAMARGALARLEAVEREPFYKHRLSTVELRFGHPELAVAAAREAVDSTKQGRPTFGMLAQLATCQIRLGHFADAESTISRIEALHRKQRHDVRLGLLCRLQIGRHSYDKALQTFANISNSKPAVYKAMKRDALAGELGRSVLTDQTRKQYQQELESLNKELQTLDVEGGWLLLIN